MFRESVSNGGHQEFDARIMMMINKTRHKVTKQKTYRQKGEERGGAKKAGGRENSRRRKKEEEEDGRGKGGGGMKGAQVSEERGEPVKNKAGKPTWLSNEAANSAHSPHSLSSKVQ